MSGPPLEAPQFFTLTTTGVFEPLDDPPPGGIGRLSLERGEYELAAELLEPLAPLGHGLERLPAAGIVGRFGEQAQREGDVAGAEADEVVAAGVDADLPGKS